MIRLWMKTYNTILTEKKQKHQDYHKEKMINMNILLVKKYYLVINEEQQEKLSLLILIQEKLQKNKEKTIEDQGIKPVEAFKPLKSEEVLKSLKPEELKELESIAGLMRKT